MKVVADQPPIANAGPDKAAIVGTIVTLDGTASLYGKNYDWVQIRRPAVTLTGADTKVATFVMPDTNKPLVFKLKAKAGPDLVSNDTVTITKVADVLTITPGRAAHGKRSAPCRRYVVGVLDAQRGVVLRQRRRDQDAHRPTALGTITVDPVTLGTFAFRAEGITLPAGVTRIDIFTSRGGVLENVPVTIRN